MKDGTLKDEISHLKKWHLKDVCMNGGWPLVEGQRNAPQRRTIFQALQRIPDSYRCL